MGNESNSKSKNCNIFPDFISYEILHKYSGIEDENLFKNYLHYIFKGISKFNEKHNKKLIDKLSFYDFMSLPFFVSEKLFKSFDSNNDNNLDENEFINNLTKLYCGNFYESAEIIFNLLDYDKDGKIQKDDVTLMLCFLPLSTNEKDNKESIFLEQNNSRKEIEEIINKTFNKYNGTLKFKQFIEVIMNKKSDVYLELICYFYQMKPFKKENIILLKDERSDKYKNFKLINNENENEENKIKIKLSKKNRLGPVETFLKDYILKLEKKAFNEKNNPLINPNIRIYNAVDRIGICKQNFNLKSFNIKTKPNLSFNDGIFNKTENNFSSFQHSFQEQKGYSNTNFLKKTLNNDCINNNNIYKDYINNKYKVIHNQKNINTIYKKFLINDLEEGNKMIINSLQENIKKKEIKYENWIYKILNNSIRKIYLILLNKDIYYYEDQTKKKFLGMHHLSDCIINESSEKDYIQIGQIKYYSFSITFINKSKTRKYYSPYLEVVQNLNEKIKKVIGCIKFNDYYEIKERLGKGIFGEVKLGINKKTGKKVAIKIINKLSLIREEDKQLIKSEIDIMKLCNHPNIVKLLDYFENSYNFYIVMEYINGGTLKEYLNKHYFNLSEYQIANIIIQIANGLKYLHNYGIIHRDLKPANIMLMNTTDNIVIKIMDFGLSKIAGPKEGLFEGYGSLTYVAPEILKKEPYNKEIDIWSLGIILYYMFVGHFPFEGNKEEIIAKNIIFQDLVFEFEEWENRSKKVINLIEKSLEKKPYKRINIDDFLKHPWIKINLNKKLL